MYDVLLPTGINNFYDDIALMIGYPINPWLKVCWTVLTPIVTSVSSDVPLMTAPTPLHRHCHLLQQQRSVQLLQ